MPRTQCRLKTTNLQFVSLSKKNVIKRKCSPKRALGRHWADMGHIFFGTNIPASSQDYKDGICEAIEDILVIWFDSVMLVVMGLHDNNQASIQDQIEFISLSNTYLQFRYEKCH